MEDRRNRLANTEARKWENRRQPVMEALAEQLTELKDAVRDKNNRDLLAVGTGQPIV